MRSSWYRGNGKPGRSTVSNPGSAAGASSAGWRGRTSWIECRRSRSSATITPIVRATPLTSGG